MCENLSNDEVKQISEAYCLDFIDFAKQQYDVTLDYSVDSLKHAEGIAGHLHETMPPGVDEEQLFSFGKMIGSYLGEVFIRNHPAEWTMAETPDGQSFPGISIEAGGAIYPWVKARNRIANGPEENLHHFYLAISEKI